MGKIPDLRLQKCNLQFCRSDVTTTVTQCPEEIEALK